MILNYFSGHEDRTDTTEHLKDSAFKTAVIGYGIPLCILAVVVTNFVKGKVLMLSDGGIQGDVLDGLLQSYNFGWQFAGVVAMKTGLAGALFSWYGLANHVRTEDWAHPALLAAIALMGLGVVLFAVGFFV